MMQGRVYQLNVKSQIPGERGLPKSPVLWAIFTKDGVVGEGDKPDFNLYRFQQKEVNPAERAVLWIPLETITQLQVEGWPQVEPGHLGENLTSEGIPYERLAAGQRWSLGTAIIELTRQAEPCGVLARLPYVGQERKAAFKQALEGRRGWYARVELEGEVHEGSHIYRLE